MQGENSIIITHYSNKFKKQLLLDSIFVICRIIKVEVNVIGPMPQP